MTNRTRSQIYDISIEARSGFTFVEVLVTLGILTLLLALTLPAIQWMREHARAVQCQNHLREIGVALHNHHSQFDALPRDGEHGYGYAVYLLPFLGESGLYERLNPQATTLQAPVAARPYLDDIILPVFVCPSDGGPPRLAPSQFGRSNYVGSNKLFSRAITLSNVLDGESQTLAVGETAAEQTWVLPAAATACLPPNRGGQFGSHHSGGAFFVFCDGAVRFISDGINTSVFLALSTPAAGDVPGDF